MKILLLLLMNESPDCLVLATHVTLVVYLSLEINSVSLISGGRSSENKLFNI